MLQTNSSDHTIATTIIAIQPTNVETTTSSNQITSEKASLIDGSTIIRSDVPGGPIVNEDMSLVDVMV